MGQINIGGTSASVKLQGNNTITSDQTFTFPNTGGELAINDGGAGIGADAWGVVNGDSALLNGFNVTSNFSSNPGQYQITFNTPMLTDLYSVVANVNAPASLFICVITGQTKNGFVVRVLDNGGVANNCSFNFTVHASSTITPTYTWTRDGTTLSPANSGDSVSVNSGTIELRPNGNIRQEAPQAWHRLYRETSTSSDPVAIYISDVGSTAKEQIKFTADGSITAAGVIKSEEYLWSVPSDANAGLYIYGTDSTAPEAVIIRDDTQQTASINFDGTITGSSVWSESTSGAKNLLNGDGFYQYATDGSTVKAQVTSSGDIQAGANPDNGNGNGAKLYATGLISASREASAFVFAGYNSSNPGNVATFTVKGDGTLVSKNTLFNLEPDNPQNYVSTMVDGEEQQVYSGPTLNVRDVLLSLQSKVQALEAEIETLKGGAS